MQWRHVNDFNSYFAEGETVLANLKLIYIMVRQKRASDRSLVTLLHLTEADWLLVAKIIIISRIRGTVNKFWFAFLEEHWVVL